MYHVLRTIAEDGTRLTSLPAKQRIVSSTNNYMDALAGARELRTTVCQHRKTGEVRLLNDSQVVGCARTNPPLFQWVANANVLHHGGYAIVVDTEHLGNYEALRGISQVDLVRTIGSERK